MALGFAVDNSWCLGEHCLLQSITAFKLILYVISHVLGCFYSSKFLYDIFKGLEYF